VRHDDEIVEVPVAQSVEQFRRPVARVLLEASQLLLSLLGVALPKEAAPPDELRAIDDYVRASVGAQRPLVNDSAGDVIASRSSTSLQPADGGIDHLY